VNKPDHLAIGSGRVCADQEDVAAEVSPICKNVGMG